jgi:hypothetical protein
MYVCIDVCVDVCMVKCMDGWITALFVYLVLHSEVNVFRDEFCFSILSQVRNGFSEPSSGRKYEGRAGRQPYKLELFK